MGLRNWIKQKIGRAVLDSAADELDKVSQGGSMNPKLKALAESAGWVFIAAVLGSFAALIQDGNLTSKEVWTSVAAGLAAVAALFRERPQV